jgi:hypothetical protein
MNQAHQQLNKELREYIGLKNEAEKAAFWQRIGQEASQRPETEKVAIRQAIADDVDMLRQRVESLLERAGKGVVAD